MGVFMPLGQSTIPHTLWFNEAVNKDITLAPTPGTLDAAASAWYGLANTVHSAKIDHVDYHLIQDDTSGTSDMEVYRLRKGVPTLIATISVAAGVGDFTRHFFSFISEELRWVKKGDYFAMQATAKMGGSPVAFVDIHFLRTAQ